MRTPDFDVVTGCGPGPGSVPTGNVEPLLFEIAHALDRLLETGETHVIDLRSIPLGPGEEDRIEAALGRGEILARLDALGPSEIRESRFPGVWLVTHRNGHDEIVARSIEITFSPTLLDAPHEDVRAGRDRLHSELEARGDD